MEELTGLIIPNLVCFRGKTMMRIDRQSMFFSSSLSLSLSSFSVSLRSLG